MREDWLFFLKKWNDSTILRQPKKKYDLTILGHMERVFIILRKRTFSKNENMTFYLDKLKKEVRHLL